MDDIKNVNKKDLRVQIKKIDMFFKCNNIFYIHQLKIDYDTSIQNVFSKE